MHRELLFEHRLDRRQHDGQIFRLTARHYRIDRYLFDGRRCQVGRSQSQNFLRIARRAVEHAQHSLLGRRHQRQPIRPAAREHRLLLVLIAPDLDAARFEPGLVEANSEPLEHPGLDILGAAAGAGLRQIPAEPGNAADPLPFAAVPAIGAPDLAAALEADQGRHHLDPEPVRGVEHRVVNPSWHGFGKGRIVLGIDGEPLFPREVPEHRRRHDANRAVVLDYRHQAVMREVLRHRVTRSLLAGSRMNRLDDHYKQVAAKSQSGYWRETMVKSSCRAPAATRIECQMISSYPPAIRRQLLSKHFLISTMPEAALDDLVKFTTVARFEPHRVIFSKGDKGDCLYGILSGRVRIYSNSAEGAEIMLNVLEQGDLFGEVALLDGSTRTASAAAMEQADLLRIHRAHFLPYVKANPDLILAILTLLCQRLRWSTSVIEDAAFLAFPARLAKRKR